MPVTNFNDQRAGTTLKPNVSLHHPGIRPQHLGLRQLRPGLRTQLLEKAHSRAYPEEPTIYASSERITTSSTVTTTAKEKVNVPDKQFAHKMVSSDATLVEARENIRKMINVIGMDRVISSIQAERIKQVFDICNNESFLSNSLYKKYNAKYYYSKQYNVSYCKVPKAGSTFWTQAFEILKNGKQGDDIFKLERKNVHQQTSPLKVRFKSKRRKQSRSVLVSRDQFLDFIIANAKEGKTLDRHWTPIFNLCRPCEVNAHILVKQESFSADVEYTLRAFGVDDEKLDMILPALHEKRIEDTVPGIIDTLYDKVKRSCIDTYSITKRLWKSLRIQGFLKDELPFPDKEFEHKLLRSQTVKDVVMDYTNYTSRYPTTLLERKYQRHKALVEGYANIKEDTIKGIQKLYEVDFKKFGYDNNPPHM
ncbi:uncharacterized protein LOC128551028 [Mercenaria mercenaria]|uniref:uncharacterized protein LOC128551028 n=1 Tax=Mercenaria mercenaria TaxID=6596 RepID=UPI00234EB028|nr:uncharacterized protein LOC128551028 [Mercenaria mercenaria]